MVQVTEVRGPALQTVPAGALAIVVNLTGINHGSGGDVPGRLPTGGPTPTASSVNIGASVAQANLAVVPLSASGQITVFNAVGSADVIVDVQGYFAAPAGLWRGAG